MTLEGDCELDNKPFIVSDKEFQELFGDSDEEQNFIGFDDGKPLMEAKSVHSPRKLRKSMYADYLSPNEDNPYKKKYLNYRKHSRYKEETVLKVNNNSNKATKLPCKFENPKSLPSLEPFCKIVQLESHKNLSSANKTAKSLLSKACKTKLRKAAITSSSNSLKMTIRYSHCSRPKRIQKSTLNHDFVYDTPALKRKYKMLLSPPTVASSEMKCEMISNDLHLSEASPVMKKKARIKYATDSGSPILQPRKKIKIKNISPLKEMSLSQYERATLVLEDQEGNCKSLNLQQSSCNPNEMHEIKDHSEIMQTSNESWNTDKCGVKDNNCEVIPTSDEFTKEHTNKIEESLHRDVSKQKVSKTELNSILAERERGWPFWNSYIDTNLTDRRLSRKQESNNKNIHEKEKQVSEKIHNTSVLETQKPLNRITQKKDKESFSFTDACPDTKRMKAVKVNGVLKFANMKNELITFCKECESCRKEIDCGECKHCRNPKGHSIRLLPCWTRRCSKPIIGPVIKVKMKKLMKGKPTKKIKHKEKGPSEGSRKDDHLSKCDEASEKVEVSFVSDALHHIKDSNDATEDHAQVEFKVLQKKKKNLNTSAGSDVFTGMSPIKPKLRSTMNELMKQKSSPDRLNSLPLLPCGPETVVKLPWPHDTNEDAAWIAGHHLCTIDSGEISLRNLCFLCGSAGEEKMLICTYCCESFHLYCLDVEPVSKVNWCCDRCKRCVVCGLKENLLMCDKCHDCYHAECLGPYYQKDTEGVEETWVCGKCVKCIKCNRRTAGNQRTSKWTYNFSMCEDCGYNWKRSNYCPVCEKIYNEDDDSLKMMFCSKCEKWIHMECEGINVDDYEILAELPENIPYVCKLCTGHDKSHSAWYKEVKVEMHNGFLKIYYDLVSHRDYKMLKRGLSDNQGICSCLQTFDILFNTLQNHEYTCINEFYILMFEALKQLCRNIKESSVCDVSMGIFPDGVALLSNFEKGIKTIFPWFSSNSSSDISETKVTSSPTKSDIADSITKVEIKFNGQEKSLIHDHIYVSLQKKSCKDMIDIKNVQKTEDNRRCLFCATCGDGSEYGAGRLLYCGMNEWVHINCALWSAEVYEDEDGRLKQVNDALKRGNKLKCEYCDQWGASIGCCHLKCSKSYHFICAIKSDVIFQDDKKIFCQLHASKANVNLILSEKELAVSRRVLVDLARFKSLKRVQRGLNPNFIRLFCGAFSLQSLGSLNDKSDIKKLLAPVGYRVKRLFWSTQDPLQRCNYICEIDVLNQIEEKEELEKKNETEIVEESVTYCHDKVEWTKLTQENTCQCNQHGTLPGQKKGVKRKIGFKESCEKCNALRKYVYLSHEEFLSKHKLSVKNKVLSSDHNFYSTHNKTRIGEKVYNLKKVEKVTSNSKEIHSRQTDCNIIVKKTTESQVKLKSLISTSLNKIRNCEKPLNEIPLNQDSTKEVKTAEPEQSSALLEESGVHPDVMIDFTNTDPNNVTKTSGKICPEATIHQFMDVVQSMKSPSNKPFGLTVASTSAVSVQSMKSPSNKPFGLTVASTSAVSTRSPLNTTPSMRTSSASVASTNSMSLKNLVGMSSSASVISNKFSSNTVLDKTIILTTSSAHAHPKMFSADSYKANGKSISIVSSNSNPLIKLQSQASIHHVASPTLQTVSNKTILPVDKSVLHKFSSNETMSPINIVSVKHPVVKSQQFIMPNILLSPKKQKGDITVLKMTDRSRIGTKIMVNPFKEALTTKQNSPAKKTVLNENILQHASKLINIAPKQSTTYSTLPVIAMTNTFNGLTPVLATVTPRSNVGSALTISLPQEIASNHQRIVQCINTNNLYTKTIIGNVVTPLEFANPRVIHQRYAQISVSGCDDRTNQLLHVRSNVMPTMPNNDPPNIISASTGALPIVIKRDVANTLPPKCDTIISPPPLITDTSNQIGYSDTTSEQSLSNPDLAKEINDYFSHLKSRHVSALQSAGKLSFPKTSVGEKTSNSSNGNLLDTGSASKYHLSSKTENQDKEGTNVMPSDHSKNTQSSTSNHANPEIEFKRELLFRQLKEYLTKHPDVVKVVGNVRPKTSQVPVVNLTEKKLSDDLVCYSAYLPEHLWTELINAGIASNDIQKIIRESKENTDEKMVTKDDILLPASSADAFRGTSSNTIPKLPSLNTSIKHLYDNTIQNAMIATAVQNKIHGNANIHGLSLPHVSAIPKLENINQNSNLYQPLDMNKTKYWNNVHVRNLNVTQNSDIVGNYAKQRLYENPTHILKSNLVPNDLKINNGLDPVSWNSLIHTAHQMVMAPVVKPKRKYRKRIKVANEECSKSTADCENAVSVSKSGTLPTPSLDFDTSVHSRPCGPVLSKRKRVKESVDVPCANTEFDVCAFNENVGADQFVYNTVEISTCEQSKVNKSERRVKRVKKHKRDYTACLKTLLAKEEKEKVEKSQTSLKFVLKNDDGWASESSSLEEIWKQLITEINDLRMDINLPPFIVDVNDAYDFIGLSKEFVCYLVEQLPGGHKCRNYKFQHHLPCVTEDDQDLPVNPHGCARAEVVVKNGDNDMFAWLASPYRIPPKQCDDVPDDEILGGAQELPVAMKYRLLKNTSKDHVGVFRSGIQGRGLFCKKSLEAGDMIVEYSGEKIRAVLTDRREEYYEQKGYGCYMFRIDDMDVVDATMKGNAARFINHSCEPNCFSKIISVDGCKKIVIFALRRIIAGEELTYDYKFQQEEDKLLCYCGAKKCRKYLN